MPNNTFRFGDPKNVPPMIKTTAPIAMSVLSPLKFSEMKFFNIVVCGWMVRVETVVVFKFK